MKKNCELAVSTLSPRRAMPTTPRVNGTLENSCFRFGYFEPPVPLKFWPSPVCAMKPSITRWNGTLLYTFARELLDPLGMLGRDIGAQLEHDAALRGVDDDRIRPFDAGGQRLRDRGSRADQRGDEGQNSDHDNSGSEIEELATSVGEFCLQAAATAGGTKAETSPPMAAIWRTSVAVIGRTATDAGRNTVWTSGRHGLVHAGICIS